MKKIVIGLAGLLIPMLATESGRRLVARQPARR